MVFRKKTGIFDLWILGLVDILSLEIRRHLNCQQTLKQWIINIIGFALIIGCGFPIVYASCTESLCREKGDGYDCHAVEGSREWICRQAMTVTAERVTVVPEQSVFAEPVKSVAAVSAIPAASVAHENANGTYAIQLASFANQHNAELLVARLHEQGFVAIYNKFRGNQGLWYQVVAGKCSNKDEAESLQKVLATTIQMKGFIIKT